MSLTPSDHSNSEGQTVDLLAEEFLLRYRRGERPSINEYIQRSPQHAAEIQEVLSAVVMVENIKPTIRELKSSAESSASPIRQLGDYRIVREIGRGGMGVVYEAEQISLRRTVALKLLSHSLIDNPNQRQRFEREARAAARLHHTNIVPVFGVGCEGDLNYYVMQFISGQSLDRVIVEMKQSNVFSISAGTKPERSDAPDCGIEQTVIMNTVVAGRADRTNVPSTGLEVAQLPVTGPANEQKPGTNNVPASDLSLRVRTNFESNTANEVGDSNQTQTNAPMTRGKAYWISVARIGVQVAEALNYAHGQGVLHRDIKPSNLVLDLRGTVWVTDFGLARLDDDSNLTGTGDILGTLRYMAPESFKGQFDARSEIYALGLTLYELLALRPAFDQNNRNALLEQVSQARIELLGKRYPEIPIDLQTIVHKAIEVDPSHRYQSGEELAHELQRFIDDEPIKARRASLLMQASRWTRRNKRLASLLSIVVMLVTGIAISSTIAANYFFGLSGKLNESVRDLQTTAKQLIDARINAEKEAENNLRLAQEAETARQASQTMLADMQTERGLAAAADGKNSIATLWFANAILQTPHDPQRQAANRLRTQNWMNNAFLPQASISFPFGGPKTRFAVQPNGELLLTTVRGKPQIWNWQLEQSLPWVDVMDQTTDACWSPDGQHVAFAFESGEFEIRAVTTGEMIQRIATTERIQAIEYSPDGIHLATAGHLARFWNIMSKPVCEREWPHPAIVHSMVFNRSGTQLATACRDKHVRVFSTVVAKTESKPLFSPKVHLPNIEIPPIFVNGDRQLITAGKDNRLGWFNASTGVDVTPRFVDTSFNVLQSLAKAPNGNSFAIASSHEAIVWGVDGSRIRFPHANYVNFVAFSPDSSTLVTGCDDWTVRFWKLSQPDVPIAAVPHMEATSLATFVDNGKTLAVCGANRLRVWKQSNDGVVVGRTEWDNTAMRARIGFDQRWATLGIWHEGPAGPMRRKGPPLLRIAETQTGLPAGPPIPVNGMVDSCLCGDHRSVVIVTKEGISGKLLFHDVKSGDLLFPPFSLSDPPMSVAARPEHSDVAVLCRGGHLLIFNQNDKSCRNELSVGADSPGDGVCSRVMYSPDGKAVIALTKEREVEVRDSESGKLRFPIIQPLLEGSMVCRVIAVSPNSRWLATGVTGVNAVQVWDLATGKPVCDPLPHPGDFYGIFSIAFSPDSRSVLTGNKDGRARLWDWRSGTMVCPPLQHQDEVYDVAFTKDGQHAVTAVRNGFVQLWELKTGKLVAPPIAVPGETIPWTHTVAVAGDYVIAGSARFPIINLAPLLTANAESEDSLRCTAELVTARQLQLGELNGLSETEWYERWNQFKTQKSTPEQLAEELAAELDLNPSTPSRLMIAKRVIKSPAVFAELLRLRPNLPQLHYVLAQSDLRQRNDRAFDHPSRAIELYEQEYASQKIDSGGKELLFELLLKTAPSLWQPLKISSAGSRDGAVFNRRDDGAIIVSGENRLGDVYSLSITGRLDTLTAIRLEVLPDRSLPGNGPGRHQSGNFQLAHFQLFRQTGGDSTDREPIPVTDACASYTWGDPTINILGTIHPERRQVWHVWGRIGQRHEAIFLLKEPVAIHEDQPLIVELHHHPLDDAINLGCFRLSGSNDPKVLVKEQERIAMQRSSVPIDVKLASAYRIRGDLEKAQAILTQSSLKSELIDGKIVISRLNPDPAKDEAHTKGPAAPANTPKISANLEPIRALAIALLERCDELFIEESENDGRNIYRADQLPEGRFRILRMHFFDKLKDQPGDTLFDGLDLTPFEHGRDGTGWCEIKSERLTDAGLAKLAAVPGIQNIVNLNFRDCPQVTDAGIAHLAKLRNLTGLSLANVPITGSCFQEFGETLKELTLHVGPLLTTQGMESICKLSGLRRLNLEQSRLDREHVDALARTKLVYLVAIGTGLIDEDVHKLALIKSLESLSIDADAVTPNGIDAIKQMKSLKFLEVHSLDGNPGLSKDDFISLSKAIPALKIRSAFGMIEN